MSERTDRARLSALCGGLAVLTWAGGARAPTAAGASFPMQPVVTMTEDRFAPEVVHVRAGETVTWRNPSRAEHTVTGAGFDSGTIAAGGIYARRFTEPGIYQYHCDPHRQTGMAGTVVVDPR